MDELERAKRKFLAFKMTKSRHNIDELRMRADLAEAVRDCYKAGITRRQVAEAFDIDPSRVSRLVNGEERPGPGSRRLPTAPAWSPEVQARVAGYLAAMFPPEAPPEPVEDVAVCKYCGKAAKYRVEFGRGKMHYVCDDHKPEGA